MMANSGTAPRRIRRLHIFLVAVILATIPCYCLGIRAIRRAPLLVSPTAPATASPSAVPLTLESTPSRTPIPAYVTRTPTNVPPNFTPYTPTQTYTPEPTRTPTPTANLPATAEAALTQTAAAGSGQ